MNDRLSPNSNSLIFSRCKTISGSGTKFGCGSMQPLKIWRETILLADLLVFARAISQVNTVLVGPKHKYPEKCSKNLSGNSQFSKNLHVSHNYLLTKP